MNILRLLFWFLGSVILGVALAYADGPQIVIAPNGSVTYIYPGSPTTVIAPNGAVSYVYPSSSVPSIPVPPVYVPPTTDGSK
jgi:hypothetical protein